MGISQDVEIFITGTILEKSISSYLIFVLACMAFGLLMIFLDWAFVKMNQTSLLNLNYKNPKKIPGFVFAYVFGAGGVGFIGAIFNFLNFNINGAIAAGLGWPFILPRLFQAAGGKAKEEEPKQNIEQEVD